MPTYSPRPGVTIRARFAQCSTCTTERSAARFGRFEFALLQGKAMSQTYEGSCFCGAVQLTVTGEPVAAGFCHCSSCRSWAAAPVNAFSLWKPEAVKITRGKDSI